MSATTWTSRPTSHTPHSTFTSASAAVVVVLTVLALIASTVQPAAAEEDRSEELTARETVAAIQEVDPSSLMTADVPSFEHGRAEVSANGVEVSLPRDPSLPATLGADPGSTVGVTVPDGDIARPAKVVGDTLVYEGAAPSVDVAVQPVANGGLRHLVTIAGADAPREYAFALDVPTGAVVRTTPDGGAEVVDGDRVLTTVAAPWAKDANGTSVPTRFEVEDGALVQHVDFDADTAFPVVADPLWLPAYVLYVVGYRCGISAATAMLLYRLHTQRRSVWGYVSNGALSCIAGGLGIRRW